MRKSGGKDGFYPTRFEMPVVGTSKRIDLGESWQHRSVLRSRYKARDKRKILFLHEFQVYCRSRTKRSNSGMPRNCKETKTVTKAAKHGRSGVRRVPGKSHIQQLGLAGGRVQYL